MQTHLKLHSDDHKIHVCDMCGEKFATKYTMIVHQRKHTGEKPYKCEVCNTSFTHPTHMKEHMRIHTGEKPYQCSKCDWRCRTSSDLKRHERSHSGARPHRCLICGLGFKEKGTLKTHEKTHANGDIRPVKAPAVKKFSCNECDKSFVAKGRFHEHLKKAHSIDSYLYLPKNCQQVF